MKFGKISILACIACMIGTSVIDAKMEGTMKENPQSAQGQASPAAQPADSTAAGPVIPRPPVFSSDVTVDPDTGWHVVTLSVTHPDEPRKNISAKISPEGGSTLFSLKVGGIEFLQTPESLAKLTAGGCAVPIMYPTPNRVRDQKYVFNEMYYTMLLPGETRRLHGIVRDDNSWTFEAPETVRDGVVLRTRYDMNTDNPRFQTFPFVSTLFMEFKVTGDRLAVTYKVWNRGGIQMAYGFGLHPFWKTVGGRENIRVQADLPWRMEATEDLLPTGELIQVANSKYDLGNPKMLSQIMGFDDVFYGATPSSKIRLFYDALHIQLDIKTTPDFSHVVVYTPDRDYFCVENQTCSTDAFNLFAKGMGQRSGLRTVNPGVTTGGTIQYVFQYLK